MCLLVLLQGMLPEIWEPMYSTVSRVLVSLALLALLAFYPLAQMNLWGFWLVIAVCSYFIYWHLAEVMLIRRRAYLGYVVQADSYWRRRLWSSWWVRLLTGFSAILFALAAIGAAARLTWPEWAVIAASIFSFQLIQYFLIPISQKHLQDEHRGNVVRRVAHGLNMVVLVVAILAIHLWVTEVPDTRHLGVVEVVVQAYQVESATANLQVSAWLLGINASMYSLFWHFIQLLAAGAPWWVSLLLWTTVMTGVALQMALIWLIFLGGYAWLSQRSMPSNSQQSAENRAFAGARSHLGFVIALAVLSGVWVVFELTPSSLATLVSNSTDRQQTREDPCNAERLQTYRAQFAARSRSIREGRENIAIQELHTDIDRVIDEAYVHTGSAVNTFLDWNFSMRGQYAQLAYLMRSSFSEQDFNQLMAEKMDEYIQQTMQGPLAAAENHLNQEFSAKIEAQARAYRSDLGQFSQQLQSEQVCMQLAPLQLDIPELMQKSAVGAGIAPGMVLMARALAPGGAVVARTGTRRMFASVFARFSARAGTSATAAGAGVVCGPVCMAVLGGATWIGTDLLINYADERINRADMYEEIMAGMDEQKELLKTQLKEDATILVSGVFSEMEAQHEARFNLYRELNH